MLYKLTLTTVQKMNCRREQETSCNLPRLSGQWSPGLSGWQQGHNEEINWRYANEATLKDVKDDMMIPRLQDAVSECLGKPFSDTHQVQRSTGIGYRTKSSV